jgi:VWA domain-containing protein
VLSLDPSGPSFWGLGLCLLGAAAVFWRRRQSRSRAEAPDWIRVGIHTGILVLVGAAVLGLQGGTRPGPRTRIVILDRSRSLSGALAQSDRAAAQALAGWRDPRRGDRVALVTCGARARVGLDLVSPEDAKARLAELLAIPADDWGSDLRGALRLASGLLPPAGGEVLVVSDGRDPAAEAGVRDLLARGVPVHCFVPRAAAPLPGIRVAALEGPGRVARGAEVVLNATLEAARPSRGELILEQREGRSWREVSRRSLELRGARAEPVQVRWTAPPRGASLTLRVRVRAQGPDKSREDDVWEHSLVVGRSRQVAVCGRPLPRLASRTLSVTNVRPSELSSILRDPPELLVLSSVSASSVQDAVPALEAALGGGMGLVVCGLGAFGPGGYAESPLEELLPVRSGPAQERADRLALVVCLDASGSMAGPSGRYRQAVKEGVPWEALRPEDALGVVLFADEPRLAAPLQPVPSGLRGRLLEAELGGGTDLARALEFGLRQVAESPAEERVLVLASDAVDEPAEAGLEALRAQAATSSQVPGREAPRVLLVGIEASSLEAYETLGRALAPLSVEIARASDAGSSLRSLLQSELSARQHSVREGRFGLTREAPAEARQLFLPEVIAAYVPVRARAEPEAAAQVLGRVLDEEGGSGPWAVLGRRGRGKTAAIPLGGPVATPLISGLAGELLRPRREGLRLSLSGPREAPWVEVESREPLPTDLRLVARSERSEWELPLVAEGPRRGRAPLVRREALGAGLQLSLSGGPEDELLASRSLPPRAHDELALGAPNYELLGRLARESGGVLLAGPSEAIPEPPPPAPLPWAPFAAGLAALLLVGELAAGGLRAARARRRAEAALPV